MGEKRVKKRSESLALEESPRGQPLGLPTLFGNSDIRQSPRCLNWVGVNWVVPKTYFCHFLVLVASLGVPVVPLYCLNS